MSESIINYAFRKAMLRGLLHQDDFEENCRKTTGKLPENFQKTSGKLPENFSFPSSLFAHTAQLAGEGRKTAGKLQENYQKTTRKLLEKGSFLVVFR